MKDGAPSSWAPPLVMAGLDPAIHVLRNHAVAKMWIPGTGPGMTTEGRMTGGQSA